jgi:hypothetical protein
LKMKNATKTEIEWLITLCRDPAKPIRQRLKALEQLNEFIRPLHTLEASKRQPDPTGALVVDVAMLVGLYHKKMDRVASRLLHNRESAESKRQATEALIGTLALHDKSVAQLVGIAQRARWPGASRDPKYLRPLIQAAKNKN